MDLMRLAAVFLALVTAIGWLNVRFTRLPTSVAMLGAGVLVAGVLLGAQIAIAPFWGFNDVRSVLKQLDFGQAVLNYLLAFLIFAAGLQVDLSDLAKRRAPVWTLATVGVLISTLLVGVGLWLAGRALGSELPLPWALVFGALISPTDPIAVIGALRSGAVSRRLGSVLQGEALFNDGVALVAFSSLVTFAASGTAPHPVSAVGEVLLEAGGGLLLGFVAARLVGALLRVIDDYVVEATGTIALAVGVYVIAGAVHVSGPIAAAAAGLVVGQRGLKQGMSEHTRRYVEAFWELIDQILNALLFLLLGLQVFVLPFSTGEIGLWAAAVLLTVVARLIVVFPWGAFFHFRDEERGASLVLTWGGLRGAISLALALSLPHQPYRELLLTITFIVVAFSVLVQGLTFAPFARRLRRDHSAADKPGGAGQE